MGLTQQQRIDKMRQNTYTEVSKQLDVRDIIYNPPATIVFWNDGTKTVVKCEDGDTYNRKDGFMYCCMKKLFGNKGRFHKVLDKWYWDDYDKLSMEERTQKLIDEFNAIGKSYLLKVDENGNFRWEDFGEADFEQTEEPAILNTKSEYK